MSDPFLPILPDKNAGAVASINNIGPAPSLLFGLNDKRQPDIFGDGYLEQALKVGTFASKGNPSGSFNPYEVDFFKYYNDYNYPEMGFLPDAPNNASYYLTQTPWQGTKKAFSGFALTTWDTFLNNFAQYGRDFDSLTGSGADSLWESDFNEEIYAHSKEMQDKFHIFAPEDRESSLKHWIPFTKGSLQAYGNLINQLGFTTGTLGAAAVENIALAYLTGGAGNVARAPKTLAAAYSTVYDLIKFFRNEKSLMNAMKIAGKGVMSPALYANAAKRAVNMYQLYHASAAEAAFEAVAGNAEFKDAAIEEFKEKYGYDPTGADLQRIEKQALEVGTARFGLNTAILMMSNSLQWGNALKPFKVSKSVTDDVSDRILYKAGETVGKGEFKTIYDHKVFSKGWFGFYGKEGALGLKGAVPEGFEESFQNVIDIGTKEYVKQKYGHNQQRADLIAAAGKGFAETFGTAHGWDNFIAGALTGAISGGVRSAVGIKDRSATEASTRKWAGRLGSFDLATLLSPDNANLNIQTDARTAMIQAALGNDKYGHINLSNTAFREFVLSGIKTGKLDVRMQQLQEFSKLSPKEFADFFGLDQAEVEAKGVDNIVGKMVSRAKTIEKDYNTVSKQFKNPHNPKKDPLEYLAYEEGKSIMATLLSTSREAAHRALGLLDPNSYDTLPRLKVFDPEHRKAAIKELKATLKGYADRGPSILDKAVDKLKNTIPGASDSVKDVVAEKRQELALLEEIEEAAGQGEAEFRKAVAKLIRVMGASDVDAKAAQEELVESAVDYQKLNADVYVARRMYDHLSKPQKFEKLEQDLATLLSGLDTAVGSQKATGTQAQPATATAASPTATPVTPTAVTPTPTGPTGPTQPTRKEFEKGDKFYAKDGTTYEIVDIGDDAATILNHNSGNRSTMKFPSMRKQLASGNITRDMPPHEFIAGEIFYTADGTTYEITKIENGVVHLHNQKDGTDSTKPLGMLRGMIANNIYSKTPHTLKETEEEKAQREAFEKAVTDIRMFQGPLDVFIDFANDIISKGKFTPLQQSAILATIEVKKAQLQSAHIETNISKTFTFLGLEFHVGLDVAVEVGFSNEDRVRALMEEKLEVMSQIPPGAPQGVVDAVEEKYKKLIEELPVDSGKSYIFVGKVQKGEVETAPIGGIRYVTLRDASGNERHITENSTIVAMGKENIENYFNTVAAQTPTTAADKKAAEGNLDLEKDILKDSDSLNKLVEQAKENLEQTKKDFLDNNKTC